MKQEKEKEIQQCAWGKAWDEYKAEYTMKEIAKALKTNLPTFWRVIKKYVEQKSK